MALFHPHITIFLLHFFSYFLCLSVLSERFLDFLHHCCAYLGFIASVRRYFWPRNCANDAATDVVADYRLRIVNGHFFFLMLLLSLSLSPLCLLITPTFCLSDCFCNRNSFQVQRSVAKCASVHYSFVVLYCGHLDVFSINTAPIVFLKSKASLASLLLAETFLLCLSVYLCPLLHLFRLYALFLFLSSSLSPSSSPELAAILFLVLILYHIVYHIYIFSYKLFSLCMLGFRKLVLLLTLLLGY